LDISIVEESAISVYEQIIIQILTGIRERKINPNDSLPTIRQLASDLRLTNNTVAKAYQILERGKIIVTSGRRGTFIHERAIENAGRFLNDTVRNQIRDFIGLQLKYGISINELEIAFQLILNEYKGEAVK
jgi:GntR family transcriptional regulator